MLRGRTIVVGVSGGIAAYKACELVRWLKTREATVIVVMSPSAVEFVTPLTFQALSGNPVVTGMWGNQRPSFDLPSTAAGKRSGRVEHVDVAEVADCVVVAPATANLLARLVTGEAPDALGATLLAARAPIVVCPAMDAEMWRNPATQANVRTLAARGYTVVPPETGFLASGLTGPGRLPDTEVIGAAVERALEKRASLAGIKVLVSAGRTEEAIDPVRVLTNRSSGRMGVALAEAALARGATVTLVTGPLAVDAPQRADVVRVTSAAEMAQALGARAGRSDVLLMAAAVSDYRPVRVALEKIKRGDGPLTLTLEPNPDIVAALAAKRRPGQVFVGFALETSRGVERARAKLSAKGLDLVVLNSPADGIGGDTNVVTLVDARGAQRVPKATKREVAEHILDRVLELRSAHLNDRARPARRRGARRRRRGRGARRRGSRDERAARGTGGPHGPPARVPRARAGGRRRRPAGGRRDGAPRARVARARLRRRARPCGRPPRPAATAPAPEPEPAAAPTVALDDERAEIEEALARASAPPPAPPVTLSMFGEPEAPPAAPAARRAGGGAAAVRGPAVPDRPRASAAPSPRRRIRCWSRSPTR